MQAVIDWLPRFVEEHRARHPDAFLPEFDSDDGKVLYEAWRAVFVRHGVQDYSVATEASKYLAGEKVPHPRDHLPTLLALAVGVYKKRQAEGLATHGEGGTDTREAAERASKDCRACGGSGLVTVWHERPDHAARVPVSLAAYCDDCPMGHWIEKNHREKSPDIRKLFDWRSRRLRQPGWLADPPWFDADAAKGNALFSPAALVRAWTEKAKASAKDRPKRPEPERVPFAPEGHADPLAAARIAALTAQVEALKAARPPAPAEPAIPAPPDESIDDSA